MAFYRVDVSALIDATSDADLRAKLAARIGEVPNESTILSSLTTVGERFVYSAQIADNSDDRVRLTVRKTE